MSEESLEQLLARWRNGDESAAGALYTRFQGRLLQMTSPRIRAMLRPKVQPESVVLHTMHHVLDKIRDGRYSPQTSGEFLRLASLVAENRIRNLWEYFTASMRDIRRERPAIRVEPSGEPARGHELHPQVALAEELERAERVLPAILFQVLSLALDGYSSSETAEILGTTRQSVSRYRREIARRLGYNR